MFCGSMKKEVTAISPTEAIENIPNEPLAASDELMAQAKASTLARSRRVKAGINIAVALVLTGLVSISLASGHDTSSPTQLDASPNTVLLAESVETQLSCVTPVAELSKPSSIPIGMNGLDLSPPQIERNIEILRYASARIHKAELDFLVSGLQTIDPNGISPEKRKAMDINPGEDPDGYVEHYPDGSRIALSSYLNPCFAPGALEGIINHELGHVVDPGSNIFIDPDSDFYQPDLLSLTFARPLKQAVDHWKVVYWQQYFLQDERLSRGEMSYKGKFTNAVGKELWPSFLSDVTEVQIDKAKTYFLSLEQSATWQLAPNSPFAVLISDYRARKPAATSFNQRDLGEELMYQYWHSPDLFNRLPQDTRHFLADKVDKMGREAFAEYFSSALTNPTRMFESFPELTKDSLDVSATLQAAITNHQSRNS